MVNLLKIFIVVLLVFALQSCEQTDSSESILIGEWKVINTSGGFAGTGYAPSFDRLIIDANLDFIIKDGNDVIASGEVEELEQNSEYIVRLVATDISEGYTVEIVDDMKKYVEYSDNVLELNSECCDGFNTTFEQE